MLRTILFFVSCIWLIGLSFTFYVTMDPKSISVTATRVIIFLNVTVIFYMIMERYAW